MKNIRNYSLTLILCILCIFAANSFGQNINKISSKCPNPSKLFANVTIVTIGDIFLTPCPGRDVYVNGSPIVGGGVTGTGTTNHLTRWTNGPGGVIGDTPNTWDGTTFNWTNTLATATFSMALRPGSGNGTFQVGNSQTGLFLDQAGQSVGAFVPDAGGVFAVQNASASDSGIFYTGTGKTITLKTAAAGEVQLGDTASAGNGAIFTVNPSASSGLFSFDVTSHQGTMALQGIGQFQYQRTITAAGTVGAQTINKPAGTVNFAAGASTLVVTSVDATANSLIFANARRADATCFVAAVTPAAGSFTITMSAPCTAETSVGFLITN